MNFNLNSKIEIFQNHNFRRFRILRHRKILGRILEIVPENFVNFMCIPKCTLKLNNVIELATGASKYISEIIEVVLRRPKLTSEIESEPIVAVHCETQVRCLLVRYL